MQKGVLRRPEGVEPWRLGGRCREPWLLALESEKDSCLSGKTDFEEAFTPSFDPKAHNINIGVGLAPKIHQETPSHVPATPSPLVYPPSGITEPLEFTFLFLAP